MSKEILGWLGIDRNTKRRISSRKNYGFGGARRLGLEHLEERRMLATLTVNTNEDYVDDFGEPIVDDGWMTLRDAIAYINDDEDPPILGGDLVQIDLTEDWGVNDTIIFSDGTGGSPDLDGETITLDKDSTNGGSELWIKRSVIIDATVGLENGITIEANEDASFGYRIFHIQEENSQEDIISKVELAGLTIKGGNGGNGGGISFITNRDGVEFIINNSTIKENSSSNGGGIYFVTTHLNTVLSIVDSEIIDNHASGEGGGISVNATGDNFEFYLVGTTIGKKIGDISYKNTAYLGGGLWLFFCGSAIIDDCIFQANETNPSQSLFEGGGGGLYADVWPDSDGPGNLTISNSTFDGNIATLYQSGDYGGGGGIHVHLREFTNANELNLLNSTISGNVATNCDGGGVWVNAKYGTFNCEQNTISGNTVFGAGGGLWMELEGQFGNKLTANLTDNTISGNSADAGGGLWAAASLITQSTASPNITLNLTQNTISGNSADAGGGLWVGTNTEYYCTVTANIDHTTITENYSPSGGGLYSEASTDVTTTLYHTIVSGNYNKENPPYKLPNNIAGAVNLDSYYNFLGTSSATRPPESAPNIHSDTPNLRPLGYYGGHTQTHMPYSNSGVIDAGDDSAEAGVNGIPRYDQRGRAYKRVLGERIDIGAVEYGIGDPDDAPTIVDVIISGSQSVHDDYSFSEAFYEENIPEFRTVPVGGADTIEIVFSEWVNVDESDLYLYGRHTLTVYTNSQNWHIVDYVFNTETFTARWRFDNEDSDTLPNPFPADMLGIALNYEGKEIYDASNNQLDGEWIPAWNDTTLPPTEGLPTGNDEAGGIFMFTLVILPGDADLDNDVDGADFLVWQTNLGLDFSSWPF